MGIPQVGLEKAMATEPCSPINQSGGPQGKGTPLPTPPKPTSPGCGSNPSKGK
jgi:hypothetical protein